MFIKVYFKIGTKKPQELENLRLKTKKIVGKLSRNHVRLIGGCSVMPWLVFGLSPFGCTVPAN